MRELQTSVVAPNGTGKRHRADDPYRRLRWVRTRSTRLDGLIVRRPRFPLVHRTPSPAVGSGLRSRVYRTRYIPDAAERSNGVGAGGHRTDTIAEQESTVTALLVAACCPAKTRRKEVSIMNDDQILVSVEREDVVQDRTEFNLSDGATGDSGESNDGGSGD